jgi:hypothetical protein
MSRSRPPCSSDCRHSHMARPVLAIVVRPPIASMAFSAPTSPAGLLALMAATAWPRKLVHLRSSRISTDRGSGNGATEPQAPRGVPMTLGNMGARTHVSPTTP